MRSVDQILDDMLKYGKVKNDAALARALKVKPNTISTWRKRGVINYALIVAWCDVNNIPPAWILAGQITVKQEEIGGQTVTRATSEPGMYRQDPAFREMQIEYSILPPNRKSGPEYAADIAGRISDPQLAALVNDLLDILESDDTIIKNAITESIKASKESVGRKKKLDKSDIEKDFKTAGAKRERSHRETKRREGGNSK